MKMNDALAEYDALREATRIRLNPAVTKQLRDHAEMYEAIGDKADRQLAHGLTVLLDMHDKLEAIRRGEA